MLRGSVVFAIATVAALAGTSAGCAARSEVGPASGENARSSGSAAPLLAGHKEVESQHRRFRYQIPVEWQPSAANAHSSSDKTATVLEQIYPPAEITAEYCGSFEAFNAERVGDTRLHHNGALRGCLSWQEHDNLAKATTWRHTSFRWAGQRGVEEVTVIMRLDKYREASVMAIIDSIRIER